MAHKSSASSFAMVPLAASGLSLVDSGLSLADSGLSLADSGLSLADSGGASLLASGGASPPAVGMEGGDQTDAEVIDTLVRWGGEREQVEQLVFAQRILDDAMRLLQEGERAASSQPAGSGEDDPYAGQQAAPAFEVATSDPYGDADYDVSDPPEEDSEEELALGGAGTASEPPAPAALVSGSASAASDPAAAEEPASGGAHADGEPPLASGGFQLATRGATRQRKRGAQSYGSWVKYNEKMGRQNLSREAYDEWQQWKFAQVALEDAAVRQPPAAQARAATGVAARDDAARAQATMQASCVPQPILYALTQAGAYIVPGREEILFTGFESACPDLACLPTEWEWLPYGQQGTYALSVRQGDEALSTEAPLPGTDEHIIYLPAERLRDLRVQLAQEQPVSEKDMERLLETQSIKDHEVMTPITFYGPRGGREGLRELGIMLGPRRAAMAIVEAEDATIMTPIAQRPTPIPASAWRERLDLPA